MKTLFKIASVLIGLIFPFTTQKYVLGSIGCGLLVELWTFLNKTLADTISEVVWDFTDQTKYGRLPVFAAALLFGHWFLQRSPEELAKCPAHRFLNKYPHAVVFLGLVCAYLVWQRVPQPLGSKPSTSQ